MSEQQQVVPPLAAYWSEATQGRFSVPECGDCRHRFLPQRLYCPRCGSERLGWLPSQGLGVIYSYTVVEKAPSKAWAGQAPYVIALAELDDLSPGSRFYARLVDVDPANVAIGQRVSVEARSLGEGEPLSVLVPVEVR